MDRQASDLFFCCSLIEFMGRVCRRKRIDVVTALGEDLLTRIYHHADVLHCEPMEKTADVYIQMTHLQPGDFDNMATCQYAVPDYWDIGEVYARLVEDIGGENLVKTMMAVYQSFISDSISNYNSDFFYQSRAYIYECYKAEKIL